MLTLRFKKNDVLMIVFNTSFLVSFMEYTAVQIPYDAEPAAYCHTSVPTADPHRIPTAGIFHRLWVRSSTWGCAIFPQHRTSASRSHAPQTRYACTCQSDR